MYHVYSIDSWCDGTAAKEIYGTSESVYVQVTDSADFYQAYRGELGHINQTVWADTSNQSRSVYIEAGIWNGVDTNTGQLGYWIYWADTNPLYGQSLHFPYSLSPNDSAQAWLIFDENGSYTNWAVWNSTVGTYGYSTHMSGTYSWAWQEGGEEYDGDSDYGGYLVDPDESTAGTFFDSLEVNDGSGWHYPTDDDPYVTAGYGCGASGYCMNARLPSPGHWNWNIPG